MKMKRFVSLSASLFLLTITLFPGGSQAAVCTTGDYDRDGYYMESAGDCTGTIGLKGTEPDICDCPVLKVGADCASTGGVLTDADIAVVFNPNEIKTTQRGASFNPKAADAPGDKIDQNCDGEDAFLTSGSTRSIPDLIQTAVQFLGTLVAGVSTVFLIWGAIMFASASGEEEKTRKAKKTMVGAVVGLIIGILAATIIGIVVEQVVG